MRLLCSIALAATAIAAQTFSGGPAIDRVIDDAIAQGKLPGAVVIIGHEGKIAYRKAYGRRAVVPEPEAMTDDTIFDLASITKVVATTTALMQLFEQGKLRLNDKVTDYIPEFQGGKSGITLRNLFTHFSGLKPDVRCPTLLSSPPIVRLVLEPEKKDHPFWKRTALNSGGLGAGRLPFWAPPPAYRTLVSMPPICTETGTRRRS